MSKLLKTLIFVLACALAPAPALADNPPAPASAESRKAEQQAAIDAAMKVKTSSPGKAIILDQGVLDLPPKVNFVGKPEAARLWRAFGNVVGDTFVGILFADESDWITVVTFHKDGYVKDDDAKDWNADDLLKNLREGTEEANKDRTARGFQAIRIVDWVEPPKYDAIQHRLVWSAQLANVGAEPDDNSSVNYNTYMLGREGYISLNLISARSKIVANKPAAQALLAALHFNLGKRYEDFNASTDNVAAYGLAALVGGLAVKKLGLLAVAAAFFAKFAKLAILAFFGILAAVKKLFFGGKKQAPAAEPPAPSQDGSPETSAHEPPPAA
jgi:uncharacterized membrane-anchored protein